MCAESAQCMYSVHKLSTCQNTVSMHMCVSTVCDTWRSLIAVHAVVHMHGTCLSPYGIVLRH